MKKIFLLAAFVISACADAHTVIDTVSDMPTGAGDAGALETPPPVIDWTLPSVITLYIEEHPDLTEQLIINGCQRWVGTDEFATGIERCERTTDELTATIRVYARGLSPCPEDMGDQPVGWAFLTGANIELRIGCLHRHYGYGEDNRIEPRALTNVAAHEVGHLLGMWQHVPLESGSAMMNPVVDIYMTGLTELDHEAFKSRDTHASIHR